MKKVKEIDDLLEHDKLSTMENTSLAATEVDTPNAPFVLRITPSKLTRCIARLCILLMMWPSRESGTVWKGWMDGSLFSESACGA